MATYPKETASVLEYFRRVFYPDCRMHNTERRNAFERYDGEIIKGYKKIIALAEVKCRQWEDKFDDLMIDHGKIKALQKIARKKSLPVFLLLYYSLSNVLYIIQISDSSGNPRDLSLRIHNGSYRKNNSTYEHVVKEMAYIPKEKAIKRELDTIDQTPEVNIAMQKNSQSQYATT